MLGVDCPESSCEGLVGDVGDRNLDLCATESNPLAKGPKPKVLFGVPGGEVRALGCRWPEDPADAHRADQGPEPELFRPPLLAPEFLARSLGVSVGDGSEMF